jgi:NO-binding membrane sensor protein with MHYT domain
MTSTVADINYDQLLVVASYIVSALGAYAALASVGMARRAGRRIDRTNLTIAGIAMGGIGIWSMHFLGMLAWDAGVPMGYGFGMTALSFVAAVLTSTLALGYMAAGPFSYRRLAVSGPLAGLGVSAMHFLGMGSMRFDGFLQWDFGIVALAVGIAVVAATAALWLAFHVSRPFHRVAAALVMAAAVCTMHYTGMAAADVICTSTGAFGRLGSMLYPDDLQLLVVLAAAGGALIVGIDIRVQRLVQQRAAG